MRLVSNVTDIDDAIINRANREQRPWQEITEKCERVWFQAMDAVNVARPDDIPHATDYVDGMVAMIGRLVELGAAYLTEDGVYLSVESVPDYGLLAHQDLDQLVAGGGDREVVGAEHKRHPADFVLWKLAKPGEPSWPSPWGEGRPGWHSECVVMSLDLLGEGFDLHCGGMDLRFPHHENERAQAVALGARFANHWMHHGFIVDAEGDKMSKSLGNVHNLLDLVEQYDQRAYRLLLLQSHYRSPITITDDNLRASGNTLAGLDAFAARSAVVGPTGRDDADPAVLEAFVAAMDDDLDTPTAMALVFDTVRRANAALDREEAAARPLVATVRELCSAMGLELGRADDVPATGAGPGRGPRRRPGGEGLRHRRTPSAPSCRPTGGSWRPRRPARRSGAEAPFRRWAGLGSGSTWPSPLPPSSRSPACRAPTAPRWPSSSRTGSTRSTTSP